MEAFGNAQTIRNQNSSRFSKVVQLYFDRQHTQIIKAENQCFLLEKSRVVMQSEQERNFHIFYQFLKGSQQSMLQKLMNIPNKNVDITQFEYLRRSNWTEDKINDREFFQEVQDCFNQLNFSLREQNCVWECIVSVLLIGNLEFDEGALDLNKGRPCALIGNSIHLLSELLKIDLTRLQRSLLYKTREINNQVLETPYNRVECLAVRESLAKDLYEKLFFWIILRMNQEIHVNEQFVSKVSRSGRSQPQKYAPKEDCKSIYLVDVFGFEVLKTNSLEQLCINYLNEVLQQLYIQQIFKKEQELFTSEGLDSYLNQIEFQDNQPVISLLSFQPSQDPIEQSKNPLNPKQNPVIDKLVTQSTPGIFQLIDESCLVAMNESSLLLKIQQSNLKNPYFQMNKIQKDSFTIKHTPRDVEYQIKDFRLKNKDEMASPLLTCLATAQNLIVKEQYKSYLPETINSSQRFVLRSDQEETQKIQNQPSKKERFLGQKFRKQIEVIVQKLQTNCQIQFVRCIKPNDISHEETFSVAIVVQQLRYLGVLDTLRQRRDGFPQKKFYQEFHKRFQYMDHNTKSHDELVEMRANFKDILRKMRIFEEIEQHFMDKQMLASKLKAIGSGFNVSQASGVISVQKQPQTITNNQSLKEEYQKPYLFGATRLFFRQEAWEFLEQLYEIRMEKRVKAAERIKDAFRTQQKLKAERKRIQQLRLIAFWIRTSLNVQRQQRRTQAAITIQKFLRMFQIRRKYKHLKKQIFIVQTFLKVKNDREQFISQKKAAITIQKIQRLFWGIRKDKIEIKIKNLVKKQYQKAWFMIQNISAVTIQKHIRTFLTKCAHFHKYSILKARFIQIRHHKAAYMIQAAMRSFCIKNQYNRIKRAALKIQAWFRRCWLQNTFVKIRAAAIVIQRYFRKYLFQTRKARMRLKDFLSNEFINLQILHKKEGFFLFNQKNFQDPKGKQPQAEQRLAKILKENFQFTEKKIYFFTVIIDLEVLTDLSFIYDEQWSSQYKKLLSEQLETFNDFSYFSLGDSHTLATSTNGKVFSWGWNDCFQLGVQTPSLGLSTQKPVCLSWTDNIYRSKLMACGNQHSVLVDSENNVYSWGSNTKGQLGLGNCVFNFTPQKIEFDLKQDDQIKQLKTKNFKNYILTEKGCVYTWPIEINRNEYVSQPIQMNFNVKYQIMQLSCGWNFTVYLTSNGLLFSSGSENQHGELGTGDQNIYENPVLIESLKRSGEKITQVECGHKHTICKSSLGKVYTWGWGQKGQLGHGKRIGCNQPEQVQFNQSIFEKAKPVQISAGYTTSIVLLDNKKLLWCGNNGTLKNKCVFEEFNYLNIIDKNIFVGNMNEVYVTKILTTWSKSMGLIYLRMADTTFYAQNQALKQKIIQNLISKLEESQTQNNIDLPYVDSLANHFSMKYLCKLQSITKRSGLKFPQFPDGNVQLLEAFNTKSMPSVQQNINSFQQELFNVDEDLQFQTRRINYLDKIVEEENENQSNFSSIPKKHKIFENSQLSVLQKQLYQQQEVAQFSQQQQAQFGRNEDENLYEHLTEMKSPEALLQQYKLNSQTKAVSKFEETNREATLALKLLPINHTDRLIGTYNKNTPIITQEKTKILKTNLNQLKLNQNDTIGQQMIPKDEVFVQNLENQLKGIKSRMETLLRIPRKEWTLDDKEFMASISNDRMKFFFNNLQSMNN